MTIPKLSTWLSCLAQRLELEDLSPITQTRKQRHGPFKILAKVSPYGYRMELLPTMTCHNVQHVSLLEPAANDPYPG
jgi:hypothetical protein